jgi:2,4'-dihydroxyacetophenone dioxygenase
LRRLASVDEAPIVKERTLIKGKNVYASPEIFIPDAIPDDERLWVNSSENIWYRPLFLSVSQGFWVTVAKIRKSGIVSRHSHPQPVHGFVLKGSWRYLEHDWVARENSYVYEPPGDTHTLIVDETVTETITIFQVHGSIVYVDEDGATRGYDDVFTRVEQCRTHFEKVGLGASYVEQFIR